MARIRTVKPEFWTDERIGECSFTARLLFIATWNFADDHGGLERSAKQLKAQAFPYDNIDCEPLVQELLQQGLLIEYHSGGKKYLHIKGFRKHQKNEKPAAPRFPLFEESSAVATPVPPASSGSTESSRGSTATSSGETRTSSGSSSSLGKIKEGKIKEGNGEEGSAEGRMARAPRSPNATRLPADFGLTPERRAIAETERADPDREFANFTDHWRSASGAKARKHDWDATWRIWCRRAADFRVPRNNGSAASEPTRTWRPTDDEDDHAGH